MELVGACSAPEIVTLELVSSHTESMNSISYKCDGLYAIHHRIGFTSRTNLLNKCMSSRIETFS